MPLLRQVIGETLRSRRLSQERTLREVSGQARVSLGYLSEVERGQKEASSELLGSICDALGVELAEILDDSALMLRLADLTDVHGAALGAPDGTTTQVHHPGTVVCAAA